MKSQVESAAAVNAVMHLRHAIFLCLFLFMEVEDLKCTQHMYPTYKVD